MRVKEIMSRDVAKIEPHETLQNAAAQMKSLEVGALLVYDGDRLLGMLTDRDIVVRSTALGHDPVADRVRDVLTPGALYCYEDQDVREATAVMKQKQVRRLVVLNRAGWPVGMLSLADLAVAGDEGLAGETLAEVAADTVAPKPLPPPQPGPKGSTPTDAVTDLQQVVAQAKEMEEQRMEAARAGGK